MSGAQYHISYCQILETERRIKLSSLLKLFSKKQVEDNTSLKNLELFSSSCDQDSHASFSLEIYLSAIQGYSDRIKHANTTITLLYSRLLSACLLQTFY